MMILRVFISYSSLVSDVSVRYVQINACDDGLFGHRKHVFTGVVSGRDAALPSAASTRTVLYEKGGTSTPAGTARVQYEYRTYSVTRTVQYRAVTYGTVGLPCIGSAQQTDEGGEVLAYWYEYE